MWKAWFKNDKHINSDEDAEIVTDDYVEFLDANIP